MTQHEIPMDFAGETPPAAATLPAVSADLDSLTIPGWAVRLLGGLVPAAAVAAACLTVGRWQFGGFDHAALIDIGWRLAQGQRPYVDFPCTVPVWWMEGIGLAFRLLGPSWWTVLVLQAGFAAVTCGWSYWLLQTIRPGVLRSLLVALALQAGANLVTSYWWYNTLTTTAACVYHLSLVALALHPRRWTVNVSCVLAMALLAGCKPNVSLPLLVMSGPLLVLATRSFTHAAAVAGAAAGLTWVGLALVGISPLQVWSSYRDVAGRGLTLETVRNIVTSMKPADIACMGFLLGLCLLLAVALLDFFRAHRTFAGVAAAVTWGAGGIALLTNGENKLVDMTIMFCATVATAAALAPAGNSRDSIPPRIFAAIRQGFTLLCLLWIVYGLAVAASRDRVKAIGPFYAPTYSLKRPATPFFAALEASDEFHAVEADVATVLRELKPSSVFFGPRLQWAYAAFGIPSPRREPVWWHKGVSYAASKEPDMVAAWRDNAHDVVIFYRGDTSYMPNEVVGDCGRLYRPVTGPTTLEVGVTPEKAKAVFAPVPDQ